MVISSSPKFIFYSSNLTHFNTFIMKKIERIALSMFSKNELENRLRNILIEKKFPPFLILALLISLFFFSCKSDGNRRTQSTHTNFDQINQEVVNEDNNMGKAGLNNNVKSESSEQKPATLTSAAGTNDANTDDIGEKSVPESDSKLTEIDFLHVEIKPLLNGNPAEDEFRKYLKENVKIVDIAKENSIQDGRIHYTFIIDINGDVIDAEIMKSPHQSLSVDVLRVINSTNGKWTPGKHEGEVIKVRWLSLLTFEIP